MRLKKRFFFGNYHFSVRKFRVREHLKLKKVSYLFTLLGLAF